MVFNLKVLLMSVFFSVLIFTPLAAQVQAYDPFARACDGSAEAQSSEFCKDVAVVNPDPIYGPNGIINNVANIIAIIAGVAAVIIIMLSGLKMITSSGESQKLTEARNAIIYASIGLVVIVLARVIVGFIVRLI